MSEKMDKLLSTERPPKPVVSSIMSAPAEKKKISLLAGMTAGCIVFAALTVLFLVLFLSSNAKVAQLERDISDYKTTILNLKNQINELDQ